MNARFVLGLAAIAVAGCASSPPDHYFTLSAEPPSSVAPPWAVEWCLAGVRLPGIDDRPQLVVSTGPQTVRILEFDKWAEPLDDLVPRVLAQDLALRQGVQAANEPASRIYVVIDEFMTDDSGSARLTGRWWAQPSEADHVPSRPRGFDLTAPMDPGAPAAAPAALSRLLGLLADDIAHDPLAGPE